MKPGEDLEAMVAHLLEESLEPGQTATIERDVRLEGSDGPRQVDVVMRSRIGPFDHLTIVECKDHSRTVTVEAVDALDSVARDVNANKAVLVSRSGFSKSARQKADRLGIALIRADSVTTIGEVALDIPVHVVEYSAGSFDVDCRFDLYVAPDCQPEIEDATAQIMAAGIPEMIRTRISEMIAAGDVGSGEITIPGDDLPTPILVRNERGDAAPVERMRVTFDVHERRFQGSLSDLTSATYLHDELKGSTLTHLKAEDLDIDYRSDFAEFSEGNPPGTTPLIQVSAIVLPPAEAFEVAGGLVEGVVTDPLPGEPESFSLPIGVQPGGSRA